MLSKDTGPKTSPTPFRQYLCMHKDIDFFMGCLSIPIMIHFLSIFQVDAITSVQRQIRFSTACYPKDFGGDFTTSSDMYAADFLIRVSVRAQEEKLPF